MSAAIPAGARLAVDIGGTFTDIVLEARSRRWTCKVLTTPRAPEDAVIAAVQEILAGAALAPAALELFILGTTLATIALIERKGAKNGAGDHRRIPRPRRDRLGASLRAVQYFSRQAGAAGTAQSAPARSRAHRRQGSRVEIMETLSPVVYWKKEYRPDSGGAGEPRGGLGQVMEIANGKAAPMIISATFDRIGHAARGSAGGKSGGAG
jgi:N-methylhydantoinase B/oxoprolinase/acetone carboxylase alpha subunit